MFRYSRSPLGARQSTDCAISTAQRRLVRTSHVIPHARTLVVDSHVIAVTVQYRFWLGQRKLYAIFSLSSEELKNPLSSDPL
jgi:hypothetical protein